MTEKELRRLSRADLLEMLVDQSVELETVKKKLAAAEEALASRVIEINSAGSIDFCHKAIKNFRCGIS